MSLNDNDILSGGRGPGMIGMILALVVLAGFGVLYLFVFDEGMQGADQAIESVVSKQDKEIDSLKDVIAHDTNELAKAAGLLVTDKQLAEVKRANQLRAERRNKLVKDIETDTGELAATTTRLATYKQQHRAAIRNLARDRKIPHLETRKGKSYDNAIIRNVTDFGVDIRHDGGSARIPPEDLPEALRDELLFDPNQKSRADDQRDADDAAARAAAEKQLAARKAKDEQMKKDKRISSIKDKEARLEQLAGEIRDLEKAIPKEQFKAVSKAPQMRTRLDAAKNEQAKLRDEVSRLRDEL